MAPAREDRPITLLIAALGGEGGGVLTDWIVGALIGADYPVQSTSIPGVAQRTGATNYYVEVFPRKYADLAGKRPVMALYPGPANVDIVVASELLEAGRAIELGFVTPDRTNLIASTHRVYSIAEKSSMADGRFDGERVLATARKMAKRAILFDMAALARRHGTVLNAVLLGVIAGLEILPVTAEAFADAIRSRGVAAEANLAGFEAGLAYYRGDMAKEESPTADDETAVRVEASGPDGEAIQRVRRDFPPAVHALLEEGVRRLVDYQGPRYAATFLDRLTPILEADRDRGGGTRDFELTRETGRHLALRMAYEDIIRVADLKTRRSRVIRVRREVGASPEQPVRVTEIFKPGVEEISSILPPRLGRRLLTWAERSGGIERWHVAMRVRTDTVFGFTRLWLLARLKWWRPRSYRYAEVQARVREWLEAIVAAADRDYGLAIEVAECANLIKGYGGTHRRGAANFARIHDELVRPAIEGGDPRRAAAAVRRAREAALADPDGGALDEALVATQRKGVVAPDLETPSRAAE